MQSGKLKEQDDRLKNHISENFKKIENKINEQIKSANQKFGDITSHFDTKLEEKYNTLDKKLEERYNTLDKKVIDSFKKFGQAVDGRFKSFEQKFNERFTYIEAKINELLERMKGMGEDLSNKIQKIKEEFDIKDNVSRDIEKKHNEENTQFRNQLKPVIENLRSKQDLTKITMDVLKKQIYEKAKEWISNEMKTAVKNKEREILMNVWIDEIKEITSNVDKLKKMNPKEIKLQLNEISSTIESFKQKYVK